MEMQKSQSIQREVRSESRPEDFSSKVIKVLTQKHILSVEIVHAINKNPTTLLVLLSHKLTNEL